jgi:hypothetical protein
LSPGQYRALDGAVEDLAALALVGKHPPRSLIAADRD